MRTYNLSLPCAGHYVRRHSQFSIVEVVYMIQETGNFQLSAEIQSLSTAMDDNTHHEHCCVQLGLFFHRLCVTT